MSQVQTFYKDFLFKKQKPKSDILEGLLELNEHQLSTKNDIHSLYNVSIPTQDEVWICGRVYSDNQSSGGGGKLTEHNVMIQGSYVCSNSHSIPLSLAKCNEYSLFPGQIVLAKGRNPDGKRFLCTEIIEPAFVSNTTKKTKEESDTNNSVTVKLGPDEDLVAIVASGPYMTSNSIQSDSLELLIDMVKAKNAHALILLGPFVDSNNDLIASGNMQYTFDELLQKMFDQLSSQLRDTNIQVFLQPSLKDITQEPVYPIHPYNASQQFMKQNPNFHFVPEPSTIRINDIEIAVTSTDVIKDLTMMSVSKTSSSDKISRNFAHMLRQRSFYPVYPPAENVCMDFEAWNQHARIYAHPRIFIAASDLATFNKDVHGCVCMNPGKVVKGTNNGTYAKVVISKKPIVVVDTNKSVVSAPNTSILAELGEAYAVTQKPMDTTQTTSTDTTKVEDSKENYIGVTFHKI